MSNLIGWVFRNVAAEFKGSLILGLHTGVLVFSLCFVCPYAYHPVGHLVKDFGFLLEDFFEDYILAW